MERATTMNGGSLNIREKNTINGLNGKKTIYFTWTHINKNNKQSSGTSSVTYHPAFNNDCGENTPAHYHVGTGGGRHYHWDSSFYAKCD